MNSAIPRYRSWFWPLNWRVLLASLVALSASLPMAVISIAKLLLFVATLVGLAIGYRRVRVDVDGAWTTLRSLQVVLMALAVFALSLLWTEADMSTALAALVKHGKLLTLVLIVGLIQTRREAHIALRVFAIGQCLLLVVSWAMVAGLLPPILPPWFARGIVFSSYLDQGVIFATSTAILWHLRSVGLARPLWPRWLAAGFVLAALTSVFFVLIGRTAYVIALAMLGLAAVWALPVQGRRVAWMGLPLLAAAALFLAQAHLPSRISMVIAESKGFSEKADVSTSSGWRLNAWKRSAQAIAETPLAGHGVGSWTASVKRLQGPDATAVFGAGSLSNPHQEYLLWGVELGVGGTLLLLILLLALARDFSRFDEPIRRAGMSVVVALGIACLFNSALYDGLIGDYFCIVLGLLLALGIRTKEAHG